MRHFLALVANVDRLVEGPWIGLYERGELVLVLVPRQPWVEAVRSWNREHLELDAERIAVCSVDPARAITALKWLQYGILRLPHY